MDKKITLPFGSKQFLIELLEDGYATYYVEDAENLIRLGERSLFETRKNVLYAFENIFNQKTFNYKGANIFHVLNFAGPHASIHASPKSNGDLDIYWSNVDNPMSRMATLTSDDVNRFVEDMEKLNFA